MLRGYVEVPWGQLHYARWDPLSPRERDSRSPEENADSVPRREADAQTKPRAIVLLHQTPRSFKEYLGVLPILGERWTTVAFDTPGFGASDLPPDEESIEAYAAGILIGLKALALEQVLLVGHHTGALVAIEVAVSAPELLCGLVLSSAPLKTPEERMHALEGPGIDEVEVRVDGSHLRELWQKRAAFYPKDRPDLLTAFVADALLVADRVEEGHRAVNRYVVEERVSRLRPPVLVLGAREDPFAWPHVERWRQALPWAEFAEIPEGMVPLPDQLPEAFAAEVAKFAGKVSLVLS
jgi:pimeloyl-ACP methyl ester carboxylesterase